MSSATLQRRLTALWSTWFFKSRLCSFSLVSNPLPVSPIYDFVQDPHGIWYTTLFFSVVVPVVFFFVSMSPTFFPDENAILNPVVSSCRAIVSAGFEFGKVMYRSFLFGFVVADRFRMLMAFIFMLTRYPLGYFSFVNAVMMFSISSSIKSLLQMRKALRKNPKTMPLFTLSLLISPVNWLSNQPLPAVALHRINATRQRYPLITRAYWFAEVASSMCSHLLVPQSIARLIDSEICEINDYF